jgi:tRNA pseudouridine55 synthase
MRSVAHEMGQALTCGAHLESLRRTAVAEFTLEDAHTLEEVAEALNGRPSATFDPRGTSDNSPPVPLAGPTPSLGLRPVEPALSLSKGTPETLQALFVHPRKLLPAFPAVTADAPTVALIRSGRTVNLPDVSRARQIKVFADQRTLIAMATRIAGTLFHPKIVLCGTAKCGADTPVRRL